MSIPGTPALGRIIAEHLQATQIDDLPAPVLRMAQQHMLDTIGCAIAATDLPTSRMLAEHLLSEGGAAQATAIGIGQSVPASQAAFMNGLLARSLEFDDMAMPDLHPSGVIVPVVLAISELRGCSGAEALTATALGIELCIRIAHAGFDTQTRTSRFLQRGQDSSAICGVVAGTAIAARLLGLDAAGIAHAIGISVSLAGGLLEANRSGGTIKQFQSGFAAQACVQGALLAERGVTGPVMALEGRYGFYHCFVDGVFEPGIIADALGTEWRMLALRYKPYPTNYYTHAGIDAALALRAKGMKPENIASATLAVATPMLRAVGEPLERKQAPQTAYEGKFSAPYTFASALIGGGGLGLGIADFSDALVKEPARRALMEKIGVVADPRCDAIYPDQAPAILTVVDTGGGTWVEEIMANRGSPERPLTDEEIRVKFRDNTRNALDEAGIVELDAEIEQIASRANLAGLFHCLRRVARIA